MSESNTSTQPPETTPAPTSPGSEGAGDQNRLGEVVRDAWSHALLAVTATEEEVQKILSRLTNWVEVKPEEARKVAADLSERLRHERAELEATVESAVRRALTPFRLPTREQIAELDARMDRLEERLAKLAEKRAAPPAP